MIKLSEKFMQFLEWHGEHGVLAKKIGIRHESLINLVNGMQPSAKSIEGILEVTGWKFEDAFEIVRGKRRKNDTK